MSPPPTAGATAGSLPRTEFRPPVTLASPRLELVPLERRHIPGLARAGRFPEVWRYLRIGPGRTEAEVTSLVEYLLAGQAAGDTLPFVVRLVREDRAVGILRFFHIDRENGNVEIGTWLTPAVWRTPVNSQAKFLALRYAFEGEGVHRVVLKTHAENARSAAAIERLGAVREGTIREHVRAPDGAFTSSIEFSVLATEWPAVRARLARTLERPWPDGPLAPDL
jgi:N-acetyltransferase